MTNLIRISVLILLCSGLTNMSLAATHYKEPYFAYIDAIDTKKRIIVLSNEVYFIHPRITVNYKAEQFPRIQSLTVGMQVDYRTIKNKKTRRVEVREIWVIPQ